MMNCRSILGKKGIRLFFVFCLACLFPLTVHAAIVADHTRTVDVSASEVALAKSRLHIAYGHTSHGSQLVTGMSALSSYNSLYAFSSGGANGSLDFRDYAMAGDVGYYPDWYNNARSYLGSPDPATGRGTTNPAINVVIWSWCGQASSYSEQDMIDKYLTPMSQLELEYPGIQFVYMTGHLDGGGAAGTLHLRNNQIRSFVQQNNKVLFDFADIESYDPSGNEFYTRLANDNCDYDSDGNNSLDQNWAVNWLADPDNQYSNLKTLAETYCGDCVHSQKLNCVQKGRAVWWLWSRLAERQPLIMRRTGTGSVASSPAGISCGSDCGDFYAEGSQVTLTATPENGSVVTGWGADCPGCGTNVVCNVTMDRPRSCSVTFVPGHTLTVSRNGAGSGSLTSLPAGISCGSNCSSSFAAGSSVTLLATPASLDNAFTGWGGSGCGACPWTTDTCVVQMDSDKLCSATFEPASLMVVHKTGNGSGKVTSNYPGIDCGSSCYAAYAKTMTVSLFATPEEGSVFAGWQGDCEGNSCLLLMNTRHDVTAVFAQEDTAWLLGGDKYNSIAGAYAAAGSSATIRVRDKQLNEVLQLNRGINVKLLGGYDNGYSMASGVTTINGSVTIGGTSGEVTLSNFVIR